MRYIEYFESWQDQGEKNTAFEREVLGLIKDFNWDIEEFIKKGNSIEDLLDTKNYILSKIMPLSIFHTSKMVKKYTSVILN